MPNTDVESLLASIKNGTPSTRYVEIDDGRTIAVVTLPMAGGGFVATHEDITERRQAELKIAHMALTTRSPICQIAYLLRERLNDALCACRTRSTPRRSLCRYRFVRRTSTTRWGIRPATSCCAWWPRGSAAASARPTPSPASAVMNFHCPDRRHRRHRCRRLARRISEAIKSPYDLETARSSSSMPASASCSSLLRRYRGATNCSKNADMALHGAKAGGRGGFGSLSRGMAA